MRKTGRTKLNQPYLLEKPSIFILNLFIAFVLIFGVTCLVAYHSYRSAINSAIHANETQADLLGKIVSEHQKAAIGIVQSYTSRPLLVGSVKKKDFEAAAQHLSSLSKDNPEIQTSWISNPDSTAWVNFPVDKQSYGKDLSYREWYKGVSTEWKPYVSTVYKLFVGEKQLVVSVCVPIHDEKGKIIGILGASQTTAFYNNLIGHISFDMAAKITLIDQGGHIIYSGKYAPGKEVVDYPLFDLAKRAIREGKGNIEIQDATDHETVKYMSFAPIKEIGWTVVVEKARSEVFHSILGHLIQIAIISFLAFLLATLFIVYLMGKRKQLDTLKNYAETLRQQAALLQLAHDAIIVRDMEDKIIFWNKGAEEKYGLKEDEAIGQNIYILLKTQFSKPLEEIKAELSSKGQWEGELLQTRRDGTSLVVASRWSLQKDDSGNPVAVMGINTDITEKKRAEQEILKFNTELEERVRRRTIELQRLTETLEQQVHERTADLERTNEALRHLSSKLLSAQEEERRRIAGEIHDTLGACLGAIKFKVQSTLQQPGETANTATDPLNTILPVIQEGIEECRRLQMDLRPPMLDDLGLLATLSWFFRRFQTIYSGIHIEQEMNVEENEVPVSLKVVIYRVTQEALNNIAKYSHANLVRYALRKPNDRMELVVQDNGQGFNLEKTLGLKSANRGLGLTSMRERTELSGGSFAIESTEGKGTIIRASWPL
jgi:PAS domain S-box-containing protein